ncbi:MAG TPA: multicopper oxidase domain-containing protein [Chitinophagaceae bacterium]
MRQLLYLLLLLSVSSIPVSGLPQAPTLLDPKTQPQFVNPLPVPGVLDGRNGGTFEISITQFRQNLGLVNPATGQPMETTVWGYNGTYPGPTIVAQKGVPIDVFWRNNLVDQAGQPLPHLLPVDESLHWAFSGESNWESYGVPIVTHVHGGLNESASDGLPESWYTPGFTRKGPYFIKGQQEPYHYRNEQEAATIWYHDHALGITRLNVYAGLAGFYVMTDDNEMALQEANHLPKGPYDIGLAIQDRMFYSNGELYYPSMNGEEEEEEMEGPSHMPEFFGDFILVNGKTWPVLDVEPRQYRFRILNGSDSRFYNLFLSSGQQFIQIGTDNGLLPAPVSSNRILIGTGERIDVVLDFSDPALWGQTIILQNNAHTPFPKGSAANPLTTGKVMAFRVNQPLDTEYPRTALPASFRPAIDPLTTTAEPRKLLLFEGTDELGRLKAMLGTVGDADDEEDEYGPMGWMDPITENPALNSTEIWEIYNTTADAHTIHLHMVHMQLLSRQRFMARPAREDGKLRESDIRLLGNPKEPGPEEKGWKDTYIMYPGEVTRIITRFGIPGLSVWHCHILSHEDHEMMRPYFIGTMPEDHMDSHITKVTEATPELEKELRLRMLPNPFNTDLKVQLQLPRSSSLSVAIYDATGRRIQQVFSGRRDAGLQQFSVDGSRWSNGAYFCEIVVDGKRMVRKLTLQK